MGPFWRGFHLIRPRGEGLGREPFDVWYARVKDEIPNIPPCVAEHWIHRHGGYHCPYYWLPLGRLRFVNESWTNAEILRIGEGLGEREQLWSPWWGEELGREGSAHRQMWLGKYMVEHRTWPTPIIVLDNPGRRIVEPVFKRPLARFHLLEGHMRSAFHHYLATHGLALDEHRVWRALIAPRTLSSHRRVEPDPVAGPDGA